MEKELFKNKEPLARLQMLQDNCAAIEKIINFPKRKWKQEKRLLPIWI